MKKYDYLQAVTNDVLDYIEVTTSNREEIESQLNDYFISEQSVSMISFLYCNLVLNPSLIESPSSIYLLNNQWYTF